MKRRTLLALVGVGTAATLPALPDVAGAAPALPRVHVFKSRYCGCCGAWASHMTDAGFAVEVTLVDDTTDAQAGDCIGRRCVAVGMIYVIIVRHPFQARCNMESLAKRPAQFRS